MEDKKMQKNGENATVRCSIMRLCDARPFDFTKKAPAFAAKAVAFATKATAFMTQKRIFQQIIPEF